MFLKMQYDKIKWLFFKSNNCKCYGKQHKMLKKLSLLLLKGFYYFVLQQILCICFFHILKMYEMFFKFEEILT